jgi:hypothetical protein
MRRQEILVSAKNGVFNPSSGHAPLMTGAVLVASAQELGRWRDRRRVPLPVQALL